MRPPASHTAPQSGSGLFHRWSEFSLCCGRWPISGNPERKPQCFAIPQGGRCGWFLEILRGSARGSVFPLLLQPPRYCRFQAGICAEFDVQNPKRSANIFWTIFDGLYPFLLCFICFPALFETSVSTCSTSVCGCLCGQTPLQHLFRIGIASV